MAATINQISTLHDLDTLFEESRRHPVALLKHSDTCGISASVMYDIREMDGEINVIVIQQNRDLSNAVAERLGHRHQSPQAFVIKDGKAIYHATHYGIDPTEIERNLRH